MTGHSTRSAGRLYARWVLDNLGTDVLDSIAHLIATSHVGTTVGPFGMGVLDVARGILSATATTPAAPAAGLATK